jgi:hypothetical protein
MFIFQDHKPVCRPVGEANAEIIPFMIEVDVISSFPF